jgi:hypothetical protein
MFNWLKKKANPENPKPTTVRGFKVGTPPKSAKRREWLYGPDITASGGCRTVQHQAAH